MLQINLIKQPCTHYTSTITTKKCIYQVNLIQCDHIGPSMETEYILITKIIPNNITVTNLP